MNLHHSNDNQADLVEGALDPGVNVNASFPLTDRAIGSLKRWLSARLEAPVHQLRYLGRSRTGTVHSHDHFVTDTDRRFVLRRAIEPRFPMTHSLAEQGVMMQAFASGGVAVPKVIGHFLPGTVDALVLAYEDGVSAGRAVTSAGQNNSLARKLGTNLRRLHASQFDRTLVSGPLPTWQDQADAFLGAVPLHHDLTKRAVAAFDADCSVVAGESGDSVPLHGDYRTGNYILAAAGPVILDFDLVHLGDPRMDCAWFLSPSWRYGADALIAGGVGSLGAFIAGYGPLAQGGYTPTWVRYALSRWAMMALIQWDRGCRVGNAQWQAEADQAALALSIRKSV